MNEQEADACQWVVLPQNQRWIEQAALHQVASPQLIANMRKELSTRQIHEVLAQVRLRKRARTKFSMADCMFFTEKGLQQATDQRVAAYKATGYPEGRLADLCCGIGGDLLALSHQHEVLAVDNDLRCVTFARANCRVYDRPGVEIRTADVRQIALDPFVAWHIDPDRRPHGRRVTYTSFCTPSADEIESLRRKNINGGIKLAPAASVTDAWEQTAELEWIGADRECRQLFIRFGALARYTGQRVATILDGSGNVAGQVVGSPARPPQADRIRDYLCEPHASVIAARLVAELAQQCRLTAVAPHVAYLTGDAVRPNAALAVFQVDASMPFDMRKVKAALRHRGWGQLEIKRRGIPDRHPELRPESLQKRLRVDGDQAGVLLLMPHDGQIVAVLARRR